MRRPNAWVAIVTLIALAAPSLALESPAVPDAVLSKIIAKTDEIYPKLVEIRRQLHMHPELSGQEKETSALVEKRLRELGYEVRAGVGGYGVIGVMKGAKPGPVVAYRADMDAVASPVIGDQPYKSQVPGVKHVCGHDLHTAIGLGIAEVYASLRDTFPGTVKFLFQPSEENVQGAKKMIEDGALENPRPDVIYGVHTMPNEVGLIGSAPGFGLASQQAFELTFEGEKDAVADVAAKATQALNTASTVPSITSPADLEKVLTSLGQGPPLGNFMWIMARTMTEADGMKVMGSVRAPNDETDALAKLLVDEIAQKSAAGSSVKVTTKFDGPYLPAMVSDPELTKAAEPIIRKVLGEGSILPMTSSVPYFGEDFSYFNREVPGAFFFVGVANAAKGIKAFNHMPDYDADEEGIRNATKAMSAVIYSALER